MMKRRFSRTARVLMGLGIALQLVAMAVLMGQAPLLEYAVCAPDVQKMSVDAASGTTSQIQYETGLKPMLEGREKLEEELGAAVTAVSCAGMRPGTDISIDGKSSAATLLAVGPRYLETCPQKISSGRWVDGSELEFGSRVTLLDEGLAFSLFGSEDCVGRKVEIGGEKFQVIGTVRHRRSVGETDAFRAYVPISAVERQGLQLETMTLYALSAGSQGVDQSFRTLSAAAWGEGSFYSARKARMGALLLTRVIAFAFGMAVLFRLLTYLRLWAAHCRARIGQMRRHHYARKWLLPAVGRILTIVLGAAALLAAAYGFLSFLIQPVYLFTEWVPESFVELSALEKVFWDRVGEAARLVRVNTPEMAASAFWGAVARLGGVVLLLGLALGKKNEKKMRNLAKTGNQNTPETV